MRTAIYVYASDPTSPIEFSISSDAVLCKYETPTSETKVVNDNGRCTLTRGIYRVTCRTPPRVALAPGAVADYEIVNVVDDKDPWPDPPARFQATFSDVSLEVLRNFLPSASSAFGTSANDKTSK
jgi:hypothetical protein